MARKKKKTVKWRGWGSHGWGSKKKHRGSGSKGGFGKTGIFGQKRTLYLRHNPTYGLDRGFNSIFQRGIKPKIRAINLRDLQRLSSKKEIDASKLGYDKILGTGAVRKPIIVKAKSFSAKAREKIENAKGKAIVLSKEGQNLEPKAVPKV